MKILSWEEGVTGADRAIAVGVFDGIHLGHKALLDELRAEALVRGLNPSALTFRGHPRLALGNGPYPGSIMSLDQKLEALELAGISEVILVDFRPAFSNMEGSSFLEALRDRFRVRFLAMGENSRIGSGGRLNAPQAARIAAESGIDSKIIKPVFFEGQRISSSLIRDCLTRGNFKEAARLLGRPWALDLSGWEGRGGPVLCSESPCQLLPPPGQYEFMDDFGNMRILSLERLGQSARITAVDGNGLPDRLIFV